MSQFVNIAAYLFVTLDKLPERRPKLATRAQELKLKGTILLSPEGINLFIAGERDAIDTFLSELRLDPLFTQLEVKESLSDHQPFNRMLVKIKKEIIAFGVDGIDPREQTSRRIEPVELKRWLDEGRPVTLLDVRNDFECQVGTFAGATPIGIDDFRAFPNAVEQLPDQWKQQPVVTFCTGGIRCEKAGPFLEREGFAEVYQLDGGILRYFEECGDAHYEGECFVFDKRVALDANLRETETAQCYVCQSTLSADDRQSSLYVYEKSCPHCHGKKEHDTKAVLEHRNESLRQVTSPLPGSQPYDNERPIHVPQRLNGLEVLEFFDAIHTHYSRDQWREVIESGDLRVGGQAIDDAHRVQAGQPLIHHMPATIEPEVNADIEILYEDESIVVANKPAPLPMHSCGRFNRNTLTYLLELVYPRQKLRPVHRLDANTTGVVILARTRRVAAELQPQFVSGSVKKEYVARIQGHPSKDSFSSTAPISETKSRAGARQTDPKGLSAETRFEVVQRFDDHTALVRVFPITGRTNQIRIHLWDLGMPICGDPLYLPDRQIGDSSTLSVDDPQLCLHAERITFRHPESGESVAFETRPVWLLPVQ